MYKKVTDWLFRSEAAELNPDAEIIGQYIDSKTKIKVRCKICGEEYFDLPSNILSGKLHRKTETGNNGCKWCKHWHHTKKQQVHILKKINYIYKNVNDINFIAPYNPVSEQIQCQCKKCGNIFMETLDNLYNLKYSCDKCLFTPISNDSFEAKKFIREKKIYNLFKNSENINLISKNKSVIKCKCNICNNTFDITGYMNRRKIICPDCNKEKRNSFKKDRRFEKKNAEYTSIKRKCDYLSRCITTNNYLCDTCLVFSSPYYKKDEFKLIVESLNPQIELMEEYMDSATEIKYRCKKCGNVYSAKPRKLFEGKCACKECHQSKS